MSDSVHVDFNSDDLEHVVDALKPRVSGDLGQELMPTFGECRFGYLACALALGTPGIVAQLVNFGVDINSPISPSRYTPLFFIKNQLAGRRSAMLRTIYAAGYEGPLLASDYASSASPAWLAAAAYDNPWSLSDLDFLFSQGFDANAVDRDGRTPLMMLAAQCWGCPAANLPEWSVAKTHAFIDLLVKHGADINLPHPRSRFTALDFAMMDSWSGDTCRLDLRPDRLEHRQKYYVEKYEQLGATRAVKFSRIKFISGWNGIRFTDC